MTRLDESLVFDGGVCVEEIGVPYQESVRVSGSNSVSFRIAYAREEHRLEIDRYNQSLPVDSSTKLRTIRRKVKRIAKNFRD